MLGPVTLAVALAGAVLAVAAVAVAQRNANNERVWFAVSGLARFSIALGVLVVALFSSDHASDFVIAVFALVVLYVIVAAIAQLRRTAGKSRKLRLFTGDWTDASRLLPAVAAVLLLLLIPGGIVFLSVESFWLSTHGGGAAIALTGSLLVLVALFVSALARLMLSRGLALAPQKGASVTGSTFASWWDSGEALGVVAATVLSLSAVLAFPACWSASNTYTFETPLDTFTTTVGSSRRPSGPGSPGKKDLFVDPVHTIFCQSTWHYDPPPHDTDDPHLPLRFVFRGTA
jgi:hypothetical protein